MNNREATASAVEMATAIIGASESIWVLAPRSDDWILPVDREFLRYASDRRLDRRYLFQSETNPVGKERYLLESLHREGWQVMSVRGPSDLVGVIVDQREALISTGGDLGFQITDPQIAGGLANHFLRIWEAGTRSPGLEIVFDDLLTTLGPQPVPQILVASHDRWDALIKELARRPEDLRSMDSRDFEQLVAELLDRQGVKDRLIRLTPARDDGGRDIMVFDQTAFGQHLFLVECKRYAEDNPVGVGLVRHLYGVVEGERATTGILVTTSRFSGPALAWPEENHLQHRLTLRDYEHLKDWVRATAGAL